MSTLGIAAAAAGAFDLPGWALMWGMAVAVGAIGKAATRARNRDEAARASWGRRLGYFLAWPGMDAHAFLDPGVRAARPEVGEWAFAAAKTAFGAALVWGVARLLPGDRVWEAAWVGMVGIIFALHFGAFHLLSLAWRAAGVEARPIMAAPIAATSAADFWGNRWNRAFRDLAHDEIFRPLATKWGATWAGLAVFAVSGVVHDLLLSVPARAGYGLPTAYFLLQWLVIVAERSRIGRAIGLGRGIVGRAWAIAAAGGPVLLLFHEGFVTNVMAPFLRAIGGM